MIIDTMYKIIDTKYKTMHFKKNNRDTRDSLGLGLDFYFYLSDLLLFTLLLSVFIHFSLYIHLSFCLPLKSTSRKTHFDIGRANY